MGRAHDVVMMTMCRLTSARRHSDVALLLGWRMSSSLKHCRHGFFALSYYNILHIRNEMVFSSYYILVLVACKRMINIARGDVKTSNRHKQQKSMFTCHHLLERQLRIQCLLVALETGSPAVSWPVRITMYPLSSPHSHPARILP